VNAGADDFAGRRFLVTGATGGIGRRVCASIGQRGGEVLVVARDSARLEEIDQQVNHFLPTSPRRVYVLDFGDTVSTQAAAAVIEQMSEPLDGIVLIVPSVPKSEDFQPRDDDWRAALDLCFVNPMSILRAGLANIREGGRVVIVSGIASVEVFPELPFSNVVRTAWLAESKRLSFGLGPRRVRINTLSLGGTLTDQFVRRLSKRSVGDVPARESPESIPLGEFGDPDDAAYVVLCLLSRFSNHITGTNVVFDGGLTRNY
jgi:3-oxoacyl-[acyl-carrier protein] reductase